MACLHYFFLSCYFVFLILGVCLDGACGGGGGGGGGCLWEDKRNGYQTREDSAPRDTKPMLQKARREPPSLIWAREEPVWSICTSRGACLGRHPEDEAQPRNFTRGRNPASGHNQGICSTNSVGPANTFQVRGNGEDPSPSKPGAKAESWGPGLIGLTVKSLSTPPSLFSMQV